MYSQTGAAGLATTFMANPPVLSEETLDQLLRTHRRFGLRPLDDHVERLELLPLSLRDFVSSDEDHLLQLKAALALMYIVANSAPNTHVVLYNGALATLVGLMSSFPPEAIVEQVVWHIGSIASDNAVCRDRLLQEPQVIDAMCSKLLQNDIPSLVVRNTVWAIFALCCGKPEQGIIEPMRHLITAVVTCYLVNRSKFQHFAIADVDLCQDITSALDRIPDIWKGGQITNAVLGEVADAIHLSLRINRHRVRVDEIIEEKDDTRKWQMLGEELALVNDEHLTLTWMLVLENQNLLPEVLMALDPLLPDGVQEYE